MKNFSLNNIKHSCYGWYMLKNSWEVFLLGEPDSQGVVFAYVMGFESEFGSVYLPEYKGHTLLKLTGAAFDEAVVRGELAAPERGVWIEGEADLLGVCGVRHEQ